MTDLGALFSDDPIDGFTAHGAKGLRASSAFSVGNDSNVNIELNSEASDGFDTDAYHDTGSNPDRFVVPTGLGGLYLVVGSIEWAANATGYREACITIDTTAKARDRRLSIGATVETSCNVSLIQNITAGQAVRLRGRQNSGGSLNANVTQTWLSLIRIGPAI